MQTSQSDRRKTPQPTVGPMSQTTNTPSASNMSPVLQLTTESVDMKRDCNACAQVPTYENILDNFCRANSGKL
jgi:hypothetical protein